MRAINVKAIRDLRQKFWQFLAVVFLLTFGVTMFIGLYTSYLNIRATYSKFYSSTNFEDIGFDVMPTPLSVLSKIKSINGVEYVVGRITASGYMVINGRVVRVKLVSIPRRNEGVDELYVTEGVYPRGREVLILQKFADLNGISVGQIIRVHVGGRVYTFRVSGKACSPEYVLIYERTSVLTSPKDYGIIFVPYKVMERITGLRGRVTEIHVKVYPGYDVNEIKNRIEEILRPYGIIDEYKREDQPSYKLLRMDLQGFRSTAFMFPALLFTISLLAVYILLSRIVLEQTRVIATLRAIGYSKRSVLLHYLTHPLLIGLIGSALGILLGLKFSALMTSSYISVLNLPYYVCLPYPKILASCLILGISIPLISGILTAKRAAEVDPAVAMRGLEVVTVRIPRLEFLPVTLRYSVRNLVRNPKRTLYTVIGVAMGFVLIMTSMAFINSVDEMMKIQFGKVERFDYMVCTGNVRGIRELKDVREAYPVVETWIVFERNGIRKSCVLIGLPIQNLYNIYTVNGRKVFPPPDGLIVPKMIAENLSISEGEYVKALTPVGVVRFKVSKVISEPLVQVCYASLRTLERVGIRPNRVIVKGGSEGELRRFGTVISLKRMKRTTEEMMSIMNNFFLFSFAMGTALAFAEIFNTSIINAFERRREFATLMMLGYGVGDLLKFICVENALMGLMGVIIGVPLGLATFNAFKMNYKSEMFNMPFVIYPSTYVFSTLAIALAFAISILPVYRFLRRLEIDRVTKEVE